MTPIRAIAVVTSGLALLASPALVASPALAQQPDDDWDMTVQPSAFLTAATLNFGANLVAVRCRGTTLDVMISGVPAGANMNRPLQVSIGGVNDERQTWLSTPGGTVISPPNPDRIARQLRAGGTLDVRVEAVAADDRFAATPPRRYQLPVPASAAAIERVLTACGRPLNSPRDSIPVIDAGDPRVTWTVPPRPEFPQKAQHAGVEQGRVRISCLVGDGGRPEDCEVVSVNPAGAGFEEAALAALGSARLAIDGVAADRSHAVEFYSVFTVR